MSASVVQPDVIHEAIEALDQIIADAPNDPIRYPLMGLRKHLEAQRQMLADAAVRMDEALTKLQMPVIDDHKMHWAVKQGIEDHARGAVRALNWRNIIAASTALVVMLFVGVAGGWLLARNQMVAVPELSDAIRAKDAATWVSIIAQNPNITDCTRLKIDNPSGEACGVWVKAPGVR
jgi:hypothetical protein